MPFGHEKLIVYQQGMRFAVVRSDLIDALPRRVAGTDQAKFYGIAYKATIQSASLVDLAPVKAAGVATRAEGGRELLRRIASMITAFSKAAAHD